MLAQPEVDDSIKDDAGKTPLERAGPETARLIGVSRSQFNANYIELLAAYISTGNSEPLLAHLTKKRARCTDFSARVPTGSRGTTILHEAARLALL